MNYDEPDNPPITPWSDPSRLEGVRLCLNLIADAAMTRRDPRRRSAKFIAARLIVMMKLLDVDSNSLKAWQRETGISASALSKIGKAMAEGLGMQATWQRVSSRETYRQRARGVHAGTWRCSPQWERRKGRGKLTPAKAILPAQQ